MSRATDVKDLLDEEAREQDLLVESHGQKWKVTNLNSGLVKFLPKNGAGRSLKNFRTQLHSLRPPPSPMLAATEGTDFMPRDTWWKVEDLIAAARMQGLRPYVSGGILCVPGDLDAQPIAEMLRDREAEVVAYLAPAHARPNQSESDHMPKIADTARIDRTGPARNIAGDAEALWSLLREEARKQGDKPGTNAGVPGVLWAGALIRIVQEIGEGWDAIHVQEVRQYLNRTEHTHCQRPKAKPPIWWIADTWSDGGLTVTRIPEAGDLERAEPQQPKPAAEPEPAAAPGGALAALRALDLRITTAEQRAADAEKALNKERGEKSDLLTELDEVRAERDQAVRERDKAVAELDLINAMLGKLGLGGA
ncbi:hypothetical protein [Streptosporangium sp. H16]|uniref:hypothetical protein n=1 Tax=Streptosporangium sp. H16 TaxID=3444184 RepID=UPI003F7A3B7A